MCPNMPGECRWWKRKIKCWRATCSSEHSRYQAHPSRFRNAPSGSMGLEAGTALSVWLFSVPAQSSSCLQHCATCSCFISIPHFVVGSFSLSLSPLTASRDVPNGHSSSRVIGAGFNVALSLAGCVLFSLQMGQNFWMKFCYIPISSHLK